MDNPAFVQWIIVQFYSSSSNFSKSKLDQWIKESPFVHGPTREILVELKRLGIIEESVMIRQEQTFIMPQPIKRTIKTIPNEFENNWYGYFLDEEIKQKEFDNSTKWYLHLDAKQRHDDYPAVKKERNAAIVISILLLIAEVLTLVLKK